MRTSNLSASVAAVIVVLLAQRNVVQGQQQQPMQLNIQVQKVKKPVDEFKQLLDALEEAYKAPREVDKDVLDELRKQYKNPTPDREQKILREVRRLYLTTAESEEGILREVRKSYENPTAEQEDRIFTVIRKGGQLPLGAVSRQAQLDYSTRLFGRLDQDGNGTLVGDEIPELLQLQRGKWDRNLDGAITLEEYKPYYEASLKVVAQKVSTGEIYLKAAQEALPAAKSVSLTEKMTEIARPTIARFGKLPEGLPAWFAQYDKDADGQVGLYEWVKAGKSVEEFQAMDRNGDGLLEPGELLRYLADNSKAKSSP